VDAGPAPKRPGPYQFAATIARLARKAKGREPGFCTYGSVLAGRLKAEATRKRKAYPLLLETLQDRWKRYEKAKMDAGFKPTPQNPVPAADFIAQHDQELLTTWFACMYRFDPRRLSFKERPGRGESDYNGVVSYLFNAEERLALERAVHQPGSTVPGIEQAIPHLLFQVLRVLASALEAVTSQPFDAVYGDPVVGSKRGVVEGRISFKMRQN